MFIQQLSSMQQGVFLTIAEELIAADGVLASEEQNLLNVFKAQLVAGVVAQPYELAVLKNVFDTQKSKMAMLLELIGLGHADDNFDETEQTFVRNIAQALDIADSDVAECELWVTKQLKLVAQANDIIGA